MLLNALDYTVCAKDFFKKIDEELDELKETVLRNYNGLNDLVIGYPPNSEGKERIAYEAADTITAITSMLEAMEIDEAMRQDAQRKVNERNRERGRI